MRCPFCGSIESKVVDSRDSEAGETIAGGVNSRIAKAFHDL